MCCILIEKKLMHFHYMTCMATRRLSTGTSASGVMKLTVLEDLSLFIIPIYLVWSTPGNWEEDILRKNINFTLFASKLPPSGMGNMKLNFLVSLRMQFGYDWPNKSWDEARCTTDDERQWTLTHSNMSPECLRWPKNCETLIPFSVINQNAK